MSNYIHSPKARAVLEDWRRCKDWRVKPIFTDTVDAGYHSLVAEQFDKQKSDKTYQTLQAYRHLAIELGRQVTFIKSRGFNIIPCKEDSYRFYKDMVADIENNGRLKIYASHLEHDLLTNEENYDFRVVHDFFAHAAYGNPFGECPLGEENAYRVHLATLSNLAGMACATETRGQNSWWHYGTNARKCTSDKTFAEQKSFILPEWARAVYLVK